MIGFLRRMLGRPDRRGILGVAGAWETVGVLHSRLGKLWLGDPFAFPEGWEAFPILGETHTVQVMRMDFAGDVRVGALRVLSDMQAVVGEPVGSVALDCSTVGVAAFPCPLAEIEESVRNNPIPGRALECFADSDFGIAELPTVPPVQVFHCTTGFGDGSFPVVSLKSGLDTVGYQVTFIRKDQPYAS